MGLSWSQVSCRERAKIWVRISHSFPTTMQEFWPSLPRAPFLPPQKWLDIFNVFKTVKPDLIKISHFFSFFKHRSHIGSCIISFQICLRNCCLYLVITFSGEWKILTYDVDTVPFSWNEAVGNKLILLKIISSESQFLFSMKYTLFLLHWVK